MTEPHAYGVTTTDKRCQRHETPLQRFEFSDGYEAQWCKRCVLAEALQHLAPATAGGRDT